MVKYFVAFYAMNDDELPRSGIIQYHKEISCDEDITNIEEIISEEWFGDGRDVILFNFKKI